MEARNSLTSQGRTQSTCKSHYWGIKNCKRHPQAEADPSGKFVYFQKLPRELRRMIWVAVLPTTPRIVHVKQNLPTITETVAKDIVMEWEDEDGKVMKLPVGFDKYYPDLAQLQLESYGFESSVQSRALDDFSRLSSRYYYLGTNNGCLYSQCYSDVEVLAQTCRESRGAVETRYELAFGNQYGGARTWFDFHRDVLYLTCDPASALHPFLVAKKWDAFEPKDLKRIANLAVQRPDGSTLQVTRDVMKWAQICGNLRDLIFIISDSSRQDRRTLELMSVDITRTTSFYTSARWDRRRIEKQEESLARQQPLPHMAWIRNVETDLSRDFNQFTASRQDPSFCLPRIASASVINAKENRKRHYWRGILQFLRRKRDNYEAELEFEKWHTQESIDSGQPLHPAVHKLRKERSRRKELMRLIEITDFEEESELAALDAAENLAKEEQEMLSDYESQLNFLKRRACREKYLSTDIRLRRVLN